MKIRKFTILIMLTLSVSSAIFYSACSNKNRNKITPVIPDLTERVKQDDNLKLNKNKPEFKFVTPKPKLSPRFPKKRRKNLALFSCNLLKI